MREQRAKRDGRGKGKAKPTMELSTRDHRYRTKVGSGEEDKLACKVP